MNILPENSFAVVLDKVNRTYYVTHVIEIDDVFLHIQGRELKDHGNGISSKTISRRILKTDIHEITDYPIGTRASYVEGAECVNPEMWDKFMAEREPKLVIGPVKTVPGYHEVRKLIQSAGAQVYDSIRNDVLQNIAGELMARNEDYVQMNYETQGAQMILDHGFTENQKNWLLKIDEELAKNV